jgi:hypothetical protein
MTRPKKAPPQPLRPEQVPHTRKHIPRPRTHPDRESPGPQQLAGRAGREGELPVRRRVQVQSGWVPPGSVRPGPALPLPPWARRVGDVVLLLLLLLSGALVTMTLLQDEEPVPLNPVEPRSGPDPPVPLTNNESYARSRILPSGDLRVAEWIRSPTMLFSITLAAPRLPGRAPGAVRAHDLVIEAGHTVHGPMTVGAAGRTMGFMGAKSIYLSYRLTGVLEPSPSGNGRALARAISLDTYYESATGTSTRTVTGAEVLNLACWSEDRDAAPEPCGSVEGGQWQVELDADHRADRVMAQLDLD